MGKLIMPFLAALVVANSAAAHPIEIDTSAAKIVVIRPAEQWTPDSGVTENYDAGIQQKRYLLNVQDRSGNYINASSHPTGWMAIAVNDIEKAGWESSRWLPKNINNIGPATTITGAQFNEIIGLQERIYEARIAKYGSPDMQKSAFNRGTLLGYALTFGTLGAGAKFGIPSEFLGLTTGVAELVGAIPATLLTAVSPNWPTTGDFSQFPNVDIRRVTSKGENNRGVVGQIIIAYKGEKTPQAEEAAMVTAARALVGVDRSLEDVEKARAEDYNRRVAIWNDCVATGKCKDAN